MNRVIYTFRATMPVCKICGKQSENMVLHQRHEIACEHEAQEEIRRYKSELIAQLEDDRCPRCGKFHALPADEDACQRSYDEHTKNTLEKLEQINEGLRYLRECIADRTAGSAIDTDQKKN